MLYFGNKLHGAKMRISQMLTLYFYNYFSLTHLFYAFGMRDVARLSRATSLFLDTWPAALHQTPDNQQPRHRIP